MKRVLVVGAFNILHPGHIRLLRFAKECGDLLLVAVQADNVINQSIHVDESLRLEVVSSNNYVDDAFLTSESICELVERLKPDVLVKGKEHENSSNPEERLLKQYGGELLFDSGDTFFSSLDLLKNEFQGVGGGQVHLPHSFMLRHGITTGQLRDKLKQFSNLNVLVIGDLIMDEYITCDPLGMSQEDPTIVVTPIDQKTFIGGAGIVAAHAAGVGGKVEFVSVTGDDIIHEQAKTELNKMSINTHFLIDNHRQTTLKQRYRCKGKTLLRVSKLHQTDISIELQNNIIKKVESIIDKINLIVFSDFNYGVLPDCLVNKITKLAVEKGIYVVADSQSSSQIGDISRYKNTTLLTPTEREARIAMQDHSSGLVVLTENLRKKTYADNIFLKLGEEGFLIHARSNGKEGFITDRIQAINNNPKDVAGAGDSMLITAAMMLAVSGTIWQAAILGSIAAGIQVGRLGNQPLQIEEILGVLAE